MGLFSTFSIQIFLCLEESMLREGMALAEGGNAVEHIYSMG